MFSKISIKGFRGFRSFEIGDFKRFNLFVGKNNCGKSSLLEAIFLLINPGNPELPLRINSIREVILIDEKSWELFFNELNTDANIKLKAEIKKPAEKRELIIKPSFKTHDENGTNRKSIEKDQFDLKHGYSGIKHRIVGLEHDFKITKRGKPVHYKSKAVKSGPALEFLSDKRYKERFQGVFVSNSTFTKDLGKKFDKIQLSKQKSKIINALKRMEPAVEDLTLSSDGRIYCDIGLPKLVPINVLGDGIFRLLSVLLAISFCDNGIVLIDELENGLHYSSQEIIWETIIKFSLDFNVQIFATTHSFELISAYCSALNEQNVDKDDCRLYRLEKIGDEYKTIKYGFKEIEASLEREWEVR